MGQVMIRNARYATVTAGLQLCDGLFFTYAVSRNRKQSFMTL